MIDIAYYEEQINHCKKDIERYEKIIAEAKIKEDIEKRIIQRFFELTGAKPFITKSYYKEDLNGAFFAVGIYYDYGEWHLSNYDRPGKLKPTHPSFIHLNANDAELNTYIGRLVAEFVNRIQCSFIARDWHKAYEEYNAKEAGIDFESYVKNTDYRIDMIISKMSNPDVEKIKNFIHHLLDSGRVVNHLPEYLDM